MSRPNAPYGPGDIAADFVSLNDYLYGGGDRRTALQRLVELAARAVPGCEWAAVTVWPIGRQPRSLASSGQVATDADQLQYELGDGPCLVAATDTGLSRVADVATDRRWPLFSARALADTPVRGVLSFHLADEPERSALNLYTDQAGAFDDAAVTTATLFVAHARVLVAHAASASRAATLETALTTSRQIGAAIGILMTVHKVTEDRAFELLRVSSQHLNRKLRDVAYVVTQTGALPDRP